MYSLYCKSLYTILQFYSHSTSHIYNSYNFNDTQYKHTTYPTNLHHALIFLPKCSHSLNTKFKPQVDCCILLQDWQVTQLIWELCKGHNTDIIITVPGKNHPFTGKTNTTGNNTPGKTHSATSNLNSVNDRSTSLYIKEGSSASSLVNTQHSQEKWSGCRHYSRLF